MIDENLLYFSISVFQVYIAVIGFILLCILTGFGIMKLCIWLLSKM